MHEHVTNYLTAYCHGELGPEESCKVAHHLRQCPQCRVEYDEMRFAVHCAEHLVKVEAPEGLWKQIDAALDDPRQVAKARSERRNWWAWLEWFDMAPSWATLAAACATLVFGIWLGARVMRPVTTRTGSSQASRVQQASVLPVVFDLGAYLAPIQAAPRAESYDVVTSAPPRFQACEKKTLLDLGLAHVLERISPLDGFELHQTRFQDYEGQRVVQLVYSGAGEAFSVFVGPSPVQFRFGQEYSYETVVGGIPTRKVDCPYQKSYAFAGGQRKFVIISKSLDEERALQVMQFFLNAELISAQDRSR